MKNRKVYIKYVPHGINEKVFYRITDTSELLKVEELKNRIFNNEDVRFIVFYNNRNIRRKMTGDVILAYQKFLNELPENERQYCRLLLHTHEVDENGTDLPALIRDVAPEIKAVFSTNRYPPNQMNWIYNMVDVVINLSSNEGWGLSTTEAIMCEKMIVVNVTGGLQDQCGFKDENGNYLHEDIHYTTEWGTNHDGRYVECGEWVIPVFPATRSLIGSPQTPYIFDHRCKWEDAAVALRTVYNFPKEERERRGKLGREHCYEMGFTSSAMGQRFIDGIEKIFEIWNPREKFELWRA